MRLSRPVLRLTNQSDSKERKVQIPWRPEKKKSWTKERAEKARQRPAEDYRWPLGTKSKLRRLPRNGGPATARLGAGGGGNTVKMAFK